MLDAIIHARFNSDPGSPWMGFGQYELFHTTDPQRPVTKCNSQGLLPGASMVMVAVIHERLSTIYSSLARYDRSTCPRCGSKECFQNQVLGLSRVCTECNSVSLNFVLEKCCIPIDKSPMKTDKSVDLMNTYYQAADLNTPFAIIDEPEWRVYRNKRIITYYEDDLRTLLQSLDIYFEEEIGRKSLMTVYETKRFHIKRHENMKELRSMITQ